MSKKSLNNGGGGGNARRITGKLALWQNRLAQSNSDFSPEVEKMDARERLYKGDNKLKPLVPGDSSKCKGADKTSHVRNIIFENIESQVSSSIPQPKVTPRYKEDEHLASVIEHFLRNEINRMPFETMNDMAERTVPIQGGVLFLVDWDNAKRTHKTVGELKICAVHPKQLAPQPGVYSGIDDMDWFILKIPTTKETIKRKYGKDVHCESESEPEVRSADGESTSEDALTQYIGYELNSHGGIDRYSWVNDVELEDLVNYQARRQPVCRECGRVKPLPGQLINRPLQQEEALETAEEISENGNALEALLAAQQGEILQNGTDVIELLAKTQVRPAEQRYDGGPCPWCGSKKFSSREMEYEEILQPVVTQAGMHIPGMVPGIDDMGNAVLVPTRIPFYTPDMYPVILQRSVSVYGQLLGNSDVDAIADQQNTINRIEQKIIDRLVKAGTRITLPNRADFKVSPEDGERWYLKDPSEKSMIDVYEFKGDLQYELVYLNQVYEESRQILGITDSFQGRQDPTATSGVAKEYSAAQAAGRLESKRVMKNAAYATMYEAMFKFALAYSDEPRPVSYKDSEGNTVYEEFNRYDFLKQDSDGQWYWNDEFLFSCDTSAPLASNREAMWQETRLNLQTGAFGDPAAIDTLILFWTKMEELHYPGAGSTKKFLEERSQRQQQAQLLQMQAMQQQGGQAVNALPAQGQLPPGQTPVI